MKENKYGIERYKGGYDGVDFNNCIYVDNFYNGNCYINRIINYCNYGIMIRKEYGKE